MNKRFKLSFVLLFCLLAFPLKAAGLAASQAQDGPVATPTPDPLAVEGGQAPAGPSAPNDQVIADDLIVQGNACIGRSGYGTNCANAMVFPRSPLMLSDERIRVYFQDTSTFGGAEPYSDWEILINDLDGAATKEEYFAIEDYTGGKVPFKIMSGAPNNALYVASEGHIGLGTSNPLANLALVSDAPSASLSLGITGNESMWSIVANDTKFEIVDFIGNAIPVQIEAGAPAASISLDSSGDVGIGTGTPDSKLHLRNATGPVKLRFQQISPAHEWTISTDENNFTIWDSTANKSSFSVEAAAPSNSLFVDSSGQVGVGTGTPTSRLHVAGNIYSTGNLTLDGFVNERSDAAAKTAFAAVNGQDVLERLASVPIRTWSYKDTPAVRHIGPTAQDFRAAYGFGPDEKHLAALDTNGVALAAIQALDAQGKAKDARIDTLQRRVQALEIQLAARPVGGQLAPFAFGLLGVLAGMLISRRKRA